MMSRDQSRGLDMSYRLWSGREGGAGLKGEGSEMIAGTGEKGGERG